MNDNEKKFLELVAEIFETDTENISLNTDFREEIEDFNSMMGFSLIIMMEDEYNVRVSVDDFLNCKTIGDLYKKCVIS